MLIAPGRSTYLFQVHKFKAERLVLAGGRQQITKRDLGALGVDDVHWEHSGLPYLRLEAQ